MIGHLALHCIALYIYVIRALAISAASVAQIVEHSCREQSVMGSPTWGNFFFE